MYLMPIYEKQLKTNNMKSKNENLINHRDELLKKIREDKKEDKEIVSDFDIEKSLIDIQELKIERYLYKRVNGIENN